MINLWDLIKESKDEKEAEAIVKAHQEPIIEAAVGNTTEQKFAEYKRRFNIVNPSTGLRYSIPFLKASEPGYFYKYADAMELLERDPAAFKRLTEWN